MGNASLRKSRFLLRHSNFISDDIHGQLSVSLDVTGSRDPCGEMPTRGPISVSVSPTCPLSWEVPVVLQQGPSRGQRGRRHLFHQTVASWFGPQCADGNALSDGPLMKEVTFRGRPRVTAGQPRTMTRAIPDPKVQFSLLLPDEPGD